MSYTPTTWVTGDTITATKLNKMEQGIANAGGGGVVTETNGALDKNYNELKTMLESGVIPWILDVFEDSPDIYIRPMLLFELFCEGGSYKAYFGCIETGNQVMGLQYISSSATGTLVFDD